MNRERLAWTVSIVLIALLAFQLPGTLAQRDDEYSFVRELVDIHRRVAAQCSQGGSGLIEHFLWKQCLIESGHGRSCRTSALFL